MTLRPLSQTSMKLWATPAGATALSAPFVLEIFAGAARVTSCLRRLGLNSSLGVDHARKMPNAPILISDLTSQDGQELCLLWASSDQLLFMQPPLAGHAAPRDKLCFVTHQAPAFRSRYPCDPRITQMGFRVCTEKTRSGLMEPTAFMLFL